MKKILYITKEPLDNPRRGTPIRIYNIVKQISKEHKVIVSSPSIGESLIVEFYKYPEGNLIKKLNYFSNLIKKHQIEIVMTSTDIEIIIPFFLKSSICLSIIDLPLISTSALGISLVY